MAALSKSLRDTHIIRILCFSFYLITLSCIGILGRISNNQRLLSESNED
mgnify:CR=1 FL=1